METETNLTETQGTPETLAYFESKIHTSVLKHATSTELSFEQKQREFHETCYSIKAIIKQKLYRHFATNLEQYFLKKFNVSRAQVYRLMDCAAVLESLEGLTPLPHKYRICKELKQRVGLGQPCRDLWLQVLERGTDEVSIDQFDFEIVPRPKVLRDCNDSQRDKRKGKPQKPKRKPTKKEIYEEETLEFHRNYSPEWDEVPHFSLVNQKSSPAHIISYHELLNISSPDLQPPVLIDQNSIEEEFIKCQNSMTALAQLGYQLTPFLNGKWENREITDWRIVPVENCERAERVRSNSLENLIMAANVCEGN